MKEEEEVPTAGGHRHQQAGWLPARHACPCPSSLSSCNGQKDRSSRGQASMTPSHYVLCGRAAVGEWMDDGGFRPSGRWQTRLQG